MLNFKVENTRTAKQSKAKRNTFNGDDNKTASNQLPNRNLIAMINLRWRNARAVAERR